MWKNGEPDQLHLLFKVIYSTHLIFICRKYELAVVDEVGPFKIIM